MLKKEILAKFFFSFLFLKNSLKVGVFLSALSGKDLICRSGSTEREKMMILIPIRICLSVNIRIRAPVRGPKKAAMYLTI